MTIIIRYVPSGSADYCTALWDRHKFSFRVTRARRSKLGDYRFHQIKKQHIITVNGNLNRYGFLITFIHEAAHMIHFELRGNHDAPHGLYWKKIFRELMEPLLNESTFPADLLERLKIHMQNPKASSYSDPHLARLIRQYDQGTTSSEYCLEEIAPGEVFSFNGREYEKMETRRTRCLCREIKSGRKYLIPELAMVRKVQNTGP